MGNNFFITAGDQLTPLQVRQVEEWVNNGLMYYGDPDNPVEGDTRLVHTVGGTLDGERYETGAWISKSIIITDSMITDRFIAFGLLKGFYFQNEVTGMRKALTFDDQIVSGDMDHKLILTGVGDLEYSQGTGSLRVWIPQPDDSQELTTDRMEFFTDPSEDEKVIKTIFKISHPTLTETCMRWTAHTDPAKTPESLVYESISQFDYDTDSENCLLDITTGVFEISKPLQLNDMLGAKMYYTIYTKDPITYKGVVSDPGGPDEQFFPWNEQYNWEAFRKKVAMQDWVDEEITTRITSSLKYRGGYDADTNIPNLENSPTGVLLGDFYTVTVAGDFFTQRVEVGDAVIAEVDDPLSLGDWTVLNRALDAGVIKLLYESNPDTNAFTDAYKTNVDANTTHRTSDGKDHSDVAINNKVRTIAKPVNGFVDGENEVVATFTDGTRTLKLSPAVTEFKYWTHGIQYSKSASDSIVIDDVEGNWYIYYDGNTLVKTQTFSIDIINSYAFVAALYWDATNKKQLYFGREYRHGTDMASRTHARLHSTVGFDLEPGGGALTAMDVDASGNDLTSIQFGNQETEAWDEDAFFSHSARLSTAIIPVYYFEGTNLRLLEANNYPVLNSGTGRASYNQITGGSGALIEVSSGNFVLAHVFTTNDTDRPYGCFVGQNEYLTRSDARDGAEVEIQDLFTLGIPLAEIKFLGTQIIETRDSYSNSAKSRFRSTNDGGDYVDLRTTLAGKGGSSTTQDHNNLSGLQGGQLNEYYHLTLAEYLALGGGGLGYVFTTWGANMQNTGRYPTINGAANGPEQSGLGIWTDAIVPDSGTIHAITYNMGTGNNTTVFKIWKNGAVVYTFTCAGKTGVETGIGVAVSIGDKIAIEYDSGMRPAGSFYTLYIK